MYIRQPRSISVKSPKTTCKAELANRLICAIRLTIFLLGEIEQVVDRFFKLNHNWIRTSHALSTPADWFWWSSRVVGWVGLRP